LENQDLKVRTKKFALDVIKLLENFPRNRTGDVLGKQLLRSACSVGTNYRSACRAQSRPHFISKLNIVQEESDESLYWLEIALESGIIEKGLIETLIKEANELTSIFTSSLITARKNRDSKKYK
jgi:four helix bundle protein